MLELQLPEVATKRPELSMSPLIDIVFLLLIFFMVTTVFPEKDGIIIEKPESEHAVSLSNKNIIVKIDSVGGVYFQDKIVNFADISRIVKTQLKTNIDIPVIIYADKKSNTDVLIKVIDALKTGGAKQLGLATDEKSI